VRDTEDSACAGKQRFDSRGSAVSTLARMNGGSRQAALAYRCGWCSGFHIGHEQSVGDRGSRRWKRGQIRSGRHKRRISLY
jgi:hypothetical protein